MDVRGERERGRFQLFGFFDPTLLSGQARTIFLPLSTFSAALVGLLGGFKGS